MSDYLDGYVQGVPSGRMDEKRFYLPGVSVTSTCPICRRACKVDLGHDAMNYPKMNEQSYIYFYCDKDHDEAEW